MTPEGWGNELPLAGKVVWITGAAQGLGEATARSAAARGAAGLVLIDRNHERGADVASSLNDATCRAVFVATELADPDSCAATIAEADAAFGVAHGVVNAAAISERATVWDTTVGVWDRLMHVNLRAPFLLMQGAARIMRREGVGGSMVCIRVADHCGSNATLRSTVEADRGGAGGVLSAQRRVRPDERCDHRLCPGSARSRRTRRPTTGTLAALRSLNWPHSASPVLARNEPVTRAGA